jgi:hypothetical protein
MEYGFESWAPLKRHVVAVLRQETVAQATGELHTYGYRAYGRPGVKRVGTVTATDLEDALWRIREDGSLPLEVVRLEADETEPPFQEGELGPPSRAPHAVDLLLYEAAAWGWWQAEFDCTGPEATVGVWYEANLPAASPYATTGHHSEDILGALRAFAGEPGLGEATIERRCQVVVGRLLPDVHPQRASLAFTSEAAASGRVFVAVLLPGSQGAVSLPHACILDEIIHACQRQGTVHVLTDEDAKAEQVATELSNRVGAGAVGLIRPGDKEPPKVPVIVSTAAEMCFMYLRARMAGPPTRDEMERKLADTTAVCVDVSRGYARTPCEIRSPEEDLLGRMQIAPFLMLYGTVVEFDEKQNDKGKRKSKRREL